MNKASTFAVGAAFGCAFGALAALALAPQSGAQTREMAAERVGTLAEDAYDFNVGLASYAKNATSDAHDFHVGAVAYAKQAVRKATNKRAEVGQGAAEGQTQLSADELRAKIDEARERIAAQVVESAQETAGA